MASRIADAIMSQATLLHSASAMLVHSETCPVLPSFVSSQPHEATRPRIPPPETQRSHSTMVDSSGFPDANGYLWGGPVLHLASSTLRHARPSTICYADAVTPYVDAGHDAAHATQPPAPLRRKPDRPRCVVHLLMECRWRLPTSGSSPNASNAI